MSRLNETDEDFPGQTGLWWANCKRSIRSIKGQQYLREIRDALLAMPVKRLCRGDLRDKTGDYCAIGAWAAAKGIEIPHVDDIDYTEKFASEHGMPKAMAWAVVAENDSITISPECLGKLVGEYTRDPNATPEERYAVMLAWIGRNLRDKEDVA